MYFQEQVRTVDPIRRGLRPIQHLLMIIVSIFVRTVDPIRRGLRQWNLAVSSWEIS